MDYSKKTKTNQFIWNIPPTESLREPIRVELRKRHLNPESMLMNKQLDRSSNTYASDYIKSPLQKQQFLFASHLNRTEAGISMTTSQKLVTNTQSGRKINRSFSGLELKQTFNYLEQIISDMSERNQFQTTRKYLRHIDAKLGQNCQKIISRLENGEVSCRKMMEKYVQNGRRILNCYFRVQNSKSMSSDKVIEQLEKGVKNMLDKNTQDTNTRRMSSKEKIKSMKEQSSLLNSKLQKESQQMHRFFQQEKTKIKQSYEQIYRKIYAEKSNYKKQLEKANKNIEEQQLKQKVLKEKCQKIFKEISDQLSAIKTQNNQLKEQNNKEKNKIAILKELLFLKEQENSKLNQANGELMKQVDTFVSDIQKYQASACLLEKQIETVSKEIEQLKFNIQESNELRIKSELKQKQKVKRDQYIQTENTFIGYSFKQQQKEEQGSNFQFFSKMQPFQIKISSQDIQSNRKYLVQHQDQHQHQQNIEQFGINFIHEAANESSSDISLDEECSQTKSVELKSENSQNAQVEAQIDLKRDQIQKLAEQYYDLFYRVEQKRASYQNLSTQFKKMEEILTSKFSELQRLAKEQAKMQSNLEQKHKQFQSLDLKLQRIKAQLILNEVKLVECQKQVNRQQEQSLQLNIQAQQLKKQIEVNLQLQKDLRSTLKSYQSKVQQLKGAQQRLNVLEKDIVNLIQVLIRLESDKMIKDEFLNSQGPQWVKKFWLWISETKQVSDFL